MLLPGLPSPSICSSPILILQRLQRPPLKMQALLWRGSGSLVNRRRVTVP